jgi:hypothetical protein
MIAFKDSYRSYGDTMAAAIRVLRPRAKVSTARTQELAAELRRFDPHLVVCDTLNTVDPGGRAAWVRLADDPRHPSEVCVDGRRTQTTNPTMEELLAIVDEVEGLIRTGRDRRTC